MYRFVTIVLLIFTISLINNHISEAHFFGITKSVGNYQAIFQSFPSIPSPRESTVLGFSLLDTSGNNVFNVAVSTEIKESENTIHTFPEKRYEFSDISQAYTFPREGIYKIIYHAKVAGDDPIVVDFDLVVLSSTNTNWQTIGITIAIAAAAGIAWLRIRKRKTKK